MIHLHYAVTGYGPAPCEAVRKGEIGINFDVYYFYSMMNSRIRHFYDNQYPQKIMPDEYAKIQYVIRNICSDANT